jgi:Domain of unknown function (DUF5642)
MRAVRGRLALLAVGCVVLAGCSSTTTSSEPPATTGAVADAKPLDLSRLSQFNRLLPPDFVSDAAHVTETKPEYVDSVGDLLILGKPFAVDPPQCKSILKPVGGQANAPSIGMRGVGPDKQAIAVSADDPVIVTSELSVSGCERMTLKVDNHTATIERIEAPAIDGASVITLKVTYQEARTVDYSYAAVVDGHAFVLVQGRLNPAYPAQHVLSDLLAKAVAILRGQAQLPPSPTTSSAISNSGVDLERLGEIASAFPPGYPANPSLGFGKVDAAQVPSVGDLVAYGKPLTAAPDACKVLLSPVKVYDGADSASITSVDDVMDPFVSVTVTDSASIPVMIPVAGCDQFRFTVAGALPDGTVRRLAAPSFDDAISYAIRVDFDRTNPNATRPLPVEYFYIAILDGRTFVKLWARAPADFAAEPVLPDLLTKAVQSIRRT